MFHVQSFKLFPLENFTRTRPYFSLGNCLPWGLGTFFLPPPRICEQHKRPPSTYCNLENGGLAPPPHTPHFPTGTRQYFRVCSTFLMGNHLFGRVYLFILFWETSKVYFDPSYISWVVLKGGHFKNIFTAERITNWQLLNSPLQTLESVVIRRKHIYYFATFFANSCSLLHFPHKTPFPTKRHSRDKLFRFFFRACGKGKMEWVLEKAGQSKEPKGKSFWGTCVLLSGSPPPWEQGFLLFPENSATTLLRMCVVSIREFAVFVPS